MKKSHLFISVILPTYNERDNIIPLIRIINKQLYKYTFEIIVVDDHSPDGTANKVKNSFRTDKRISVYVRKSDRGLAKSICLGLENARGEWILVMDTDFNHNPEVIPRFLKYTNSYDMIVGSRYVTGGGMENKLRYIFSYLYNLVTRAVLSLKTHDNLSGYYLVRKDVVANLDRNNIFRGYGDYFIRLLYAANKLNLCIREIPVYYKNRVAGTSKSVLLNMLFSYTRTIITLSIK
jgi:dolichol-phosphate mannosyltransferase